MKIYPYDLTNAPTNWRDWSTDITNIINYGKVGFQVHGSAPVYGGRHGEMCFSWDGTLLTHYIFINSAWVATTFNSGGWIIANAIYDSDFDTFIHTEYLPDDDHLRMATQGKWAVFVDSSQNLAMQTGNLSVIRGAKIGIEGVDGDSYITYNSATAYFELYVDGSLRVEF